MVREKFYLSASRNGFSVKVLSMKKISKSKTMYKLLEVIDNLLTSAKIHSNLLDEFE